MDRAALQGIRYAVRFHLHPEVDAELDMGGSAVSLALRSGEIWVFRHDGAAELTLEPSVYLENGPAEAARDETGGSLRPSRWTMRAAFAGRWPRRRTCRSTIRDLERDDMPWLD